MPRCRKSFALLLALFLVSSAGWTAELRTLKGEALKGDVVSIDTKEIVFAKGVEKITVPLLQVLQIDYAPLGKLASDARYTDVELTDGTLFHCRSWAVKGKQVELTSLSGQTIQVPL